MPTLYHARKRLLVLHIPKTAGFAVTGLLQAVDPEFAVVAPPSPTPSLRALHVPPPGDANVVETFALVRDPYARFVSAFAQAKRQGFHDEALTAEGATRFGLAAFARAPDDPFWASDAGLLFLPQVAFLRGCARVRVGRTEALRADVSAFLTRHGYDVPASLDFEARVNAGPPELALLEDDALREAVAIFYADDAILNCIGRG